MSANRASRSVSTCSFGMGAFRFASARSGICEYAIVVAPFIACFLEFEISLRISVVMSAIGAVHCLAAVLASWLPPSLGTAVRSAKAVRACPSYQWRSVYSGADARLNMVLDKGFGATAVGFSPDDGNFASVDRVGLVDHRDRRHTSDVGGVCHPVGDADDSVVIDDFVVGGNAVHRTG